MKIGVSGCSHSSYGWGNPWHHYMGETLNAEIVSSSSRGAGNEMNLEKIKHILDNNDLEFFVYQVTQPSRLVIGTTMGEHKDGPHESNTFNGVHYYTFNGNDNESNLKRIYNKEYNVDNFIINEVIPSDYNVHYKVFHTLMSINQLCNFYNTKVVFFSWFVDLQKEAKKIGYTDILNKMCFIEGCVEDFVATQNIKSIPNDGHFESESHKKIYNNYLHPQLLKLI